MFTNTTVISQLQILHIPCGCSITELLRNNSRTICIFFFNDVMITNISKLEILHILCGCSVTELLRTISGHYTFSLITMFNVYKHHRNFIGGVDIRRHVSQSSSLGQSQIISCLGLLLCGAFEWSAHIGSQ